MEREGFLSRRLIRLWRRMADCELRKDRDQESGVRRQKQRESRDKEDGVSWNKGLNYGIVSNKLKT